MSQTEREQIKELFSDANENEIDSIIKFKVKSIQEDRQNDYGDAGASFDNIAELWSVYLQRRFGMIKLDRTDVAIMMVLMKTSRFAFDRKEDTIIDLASYADFALKFTEEKNV